MENVNMLLEPIRESLAPDRDLPAGGCCLRFFILIVGWLVAKAVRFAIVRALRAVNFNVVTEKGGDRSFPPTGRHGNRYHPACWAGCSIGS
jgi:hypothetical protein